MNVDEPSREDSSTSIDNLVEAKHAAIMRCHDRTAARLATEIKRAAKAERRLEPYVWALHTLMNHAKDLLDPEPGQEAAVELIAILESEELARQIQPDIDSAEYEWLVSQVSSCATTVSATPRRSRAAITRRGPRHDRRGDPGLPTDRQAGMYHLLSRICRRRVSSLGRPGDGGSIMRGTWRPTGISGKGSTAAGWAAPTRRIS